MTKKSAIHTLREIAQGDVDAAAVALGNAIRAHEEAEKKLALLEQYRDDYAQRFQAGVAKGLSAAQYSNFMSFINKLDDVIQGQKQVVADAERRIQRAKLKWQEHEKKRLSFDTLHHRAELVQQKKETRAEQKQTDEFATRNFFDKR